ncbi:hypothetical protein [Campylobacter sp. RM16192]|uniref:hypothetical protein n=1 Tax=Campylobacter sp. RM16192 TaxID=1660080 RepID=UPI001451D30E|nr:hypothetical protein [Campylobacter sp. RM16192]QCD52047.1 hypothetical protein CDOMC_0394 [Campylobacter sp. RM16192]
MNSKFFIVVLATIILIACWLFFATNSSYQEAIKSRFYYEVGNYAKSYELSQNAYKKDIYNKMAYTVMMQSEISLKYVKFIDSANEYLEQISKLSKQEEIDKVDKNRIRMMCEIVLEDYERLKPSNLTNKDIQNEAKELRDKFAKLKGELF